MSCKIYDGFKLNAFFTAEAVLALLGELSAKATEMAYLGSVAWVAAETVRNFDMTAAGLTAGEATTPMAVISDYFSRSRKVKASGERDPDIDWSFELAISCFRGVWYGIPFCEKSELMSILTTRAWWEEFGYWNNVDRPDNLTEEDWAKREATWEEVLPDGVPSHSMFAYTVVDPYLHRLWSATSEELVPSAPNDEQRASFLHRRICELEFINANVPMGEGHLPHRVCRAMLQFSRLWRGDEEEDEGLREQVAAICAANESRALEIVARHPASFILDTARKSEPKKIEKE